MSLSFTPGALYGFTSPGLRPAVVTPPRVQPAEDAPAPSAERARRAAGYVDALRELKAQHNDLRPNRAAQTYMDVAHFDGGFQLIDVYA